MAIIQTGCCTQKCLNKHFATALFLRVSAESVFVRVFLAQNEFVVTVKSGKHCTVLKPTEKARRRLRHCVRQQTQPSALVIMFRQDEDSFTTPHVTLPQRQITKHLYICSQPLSQTLSMSPVAQATTVKGNSMNNAL